MGPNVQAILSGVSLAALWKGITWPFLWMALHLELLPDQAATVALSTEASLLLAATVWYLAQSNSRRPALSPRRLMLAGVAWILVVYGVLWQITPIQQNAILGDVTTFVVALSCLWLAFGTPPRCALPTRLGAGITTLGAALFADTVLPFAGYAPSTFSYFLIGADWIVRTCFVVLAVAWLLPRLAPAAESPGIGAVRLGFYALLVLWLVLPIGI